MLLLWDGTATNYNRTYRPAIGVTVPRPRSEAVRRAVLDSALELLEHEGYGRLTMAGIAQRAGASKQTLYRWWPSPAAVLIESLSERASALAPDRDRGLLEIGR